MNFSKTSQTIDQWSQKTQGSRREAPRFTSGRTEKVNFTYLATYKLFYSLLADCEES